MKVAPVSTRFPPGQGGVERHFAEVALRLPALGHAVEVYTSELLTEFPWERLPASVPREETRPFGRVHRTRSPRSPARCTIRSSGTWAPRWPATGRTSCTSTRTGTHQVAVARRYGRRTGTPLVLTAHFHPIWSIEGGWLRHRIRGFYDRDLAGPIVPVAARVIVQTHEEGRLLRSLKLPLPRSRSSRPDTRPSPPPDPGGLPGEVRDNGTVRALRRAPGLQQGPADPGRCLRSPPADHPDATLVLIGTDGGMRAAVEAAWPRWGSRRTCGSWVMWTTRVSSPTPTGTLAFRSSRASTEAFGLVLLESLAQGTPVRAHRASAGSRSSWRTVGPASSAPPAMCQAFSQAIARLWEDEALARSLGAYGRDHVVPRYTWDRLVGQLDQLYREVRGA